MSKLDWCREHAPEAAKDLPDEELLELMSSSYDMFCTDKEEVTTEYKNDIPVKSINSAMDYMVSTLVSEFGDLLAFKGGYMLTKLIPDVARQTEDIDFSIQSSELYSRLINTMHTIGDYFVNIGVAGGYTIKDTIRETMSGGMVIYSTTGERILGIDIGWHDITYGTQITSISVGDVNAFKVERMLADKITAILSRKRFRRTKDIYDLYCLTNCFDFDLNVVHDYIMRRTEGAGPEWTNYPFNEIVVREYRKAYDKLTLNSIYENIKLDKPDFEKVLYRFDIIARRLRESTNAMHWDHVKGLFIC